MWQHKQDQRELKRVEGDIIKNQREVRKELRDYDVGKDVESLCLYQPVAIVQAVGFPPAETAAKWMVVHIGGCLSPPPPCFSFGSSVFLPLSLAWVVFGGVLLVAGVFTRLDTLRYGSLAVLLLAVGKVFLIDTANLDNLYRVLSFFGLGVTLIGLGYLYQRLVFKRPLTPNKPQAA